MRSHAETSRARPPGSTHPRHDAPGWRYALAALAVGLTMLTHAAPATAQAAPRAVPTNADAVAGSARGQARALWLWERDTFEILDDDDARAAALELLRRHRITTVYVYADAWRGRNPIAEEPALYHRLLRELAQSGMAAYALLGSAPLRTQEYVLPERRERALAMVRRVLDYNAAAPPDARFTGLNLDIEPHLLPDWETARPLRALQYLEMSRRLVDLVRASGQELAVGPASPFWFDTVLDVEFEGARKPLSHHVMDLHDYVALMDYRDFAEGPDGILFHAASEIAYADRTGKALVIGVETLDASPEKVSFWDEGLGAMEAELTRVVGALGGRSGFAGVAIHHFRSLRALERRSSPQSNRRAVVRVRRGTSPL